MLRPIRLQYVGFRISAGLHCIYMYIANDIYAIFISDSRKFRLALDLPVFGCFASWGCLYCLIIQGSVGPGLFQ